MLEPVSKSVVSIKQRPLALERIGGIRVIAVVVQNRRKAVQENSNRTLGPPVHGQEYVNHELSNAETRLPGKPLHGR